MILAPILAALLCDPFTALAVFALVLSFRLAWRVAR